MGLPVLSILMVLSWATHSDRVDYSLTGDLGPVVQN